MNTWEINSISSVPRFIAAIAKLLPAAHTLSFEIRNACPEARAVFERHRSSKNYVPLRDTVSPKTQLHYCVISQSLADDLNELLSEHEIKSVFWHLKGFDDARMLFAIHDADMGESAFLSSHVDGAIIAAIGSALRRKPTKLQTGYDWEKIHTSKKRR